MKRISLQLLTLLALVSFTSVQAQQGFSLGVKAVPQFSFLHNKDDKNNSSYDSKATFNAAFGVGAGYNFNGNTGIGLDVLYSLQGQKYTLNGMEYHQKLSYVKLPLYLSYNTDASRPISFIGKIGPQVSFITSEKLTDANKNKISGDSKDRYTSATFGGAALAGVQYKLSSNVYLTTALRFDYDFTNAEDDTYYSYTPGRAKTYNSTAGLEVGLRYRLR